MSFMGTALRGVPQKGWAMPPGIITVRIDPVTGARMPETVVDELIGDLLGDDAPGMEEHFYQEFPPPEAAAPAWNADPATPADPASATPGTPL